MSQDIPNIRRLFDNCFLQDGHIGSRSSLPFSALSSPTGVDSEEREDLAVESKYVNFTGKRFFSLDIRQKIIRVKKEYIQLTLSGEVGLPHDRLFAP